MSETAGAESAEAEPSGAEPARAEPARAEAAGLGAVGPAEAGPVSVEPAGPPRTCGPSQRLDPRERAVRVVCTHKARYDHQGKRVYESVS